MKITSLFTRNEKIRGYRCEVNVPIHGDWRNGSTRKQKTFKVQHFGDSVTKAKKAAKAWGRELEVSPYKPQAVDKADEGREPLGVYADKIWESAVSELAPGTRKNYFGCWNAHIADAIGHVPIRDVSRSHIEILKDHLRKKTKKNPDGLSASRINDVLNALSLIMNFALDDRVIESNPVIGRGIRPKGQDRDIRQAITVRPDQLPSLVRECSLRGGVRRGAIVEFAYWTGLRASELWALRVKNVDLSNRRIYIREALKGTDEAGIRQTGGTKTGKNRVVPIFDPISESIAMAVAGRDENELLFPSANGTPIGHKNFLRSVRWNEAAIAAGFTGLWFHDLRHSFNTNLLNAGIPHHMVMAITGHTSQRTSLMYTHAQSEELDKAIGRIGGGDTNSDSNYLSANLLGNTNYDF